MPSTTTASEISPEIAAKKTAARNPAATAKDKSISGISSDASVVAADVPEKQHSLTADEQRLLKEVNDIITPFGPLDGAVKIKIPRINDYILVHGSLLTGKSSFCRVALAKTKKKGDAKEKELTLPSHSVTTLAYFLKWIYNSTVTPVHGKLHGAQDERRVAWPDLVNLWLFASSIGLPKLQNHAVDIVVKQMHSFLELYERTETDIDLIRASFNLLWRGKNRSPGEKAQGDADKPLRTLMMDWFANPLYQTKVDANLVWDGGISRSFYRDYTRHTIEKNFSKTRHELGGGDNARAHLKSMKYISQHTLRRHWQIKPEEYYVDDKATANPVQNN